MKTTETNQGTRRHKLLTAEIRKALPALYATDGDADARCVVKFFSPYSNWTWYVFEFDGEDTFFGLVDGHEQEWGCFSYAELQNAARGRLPLVERDCHYTSQSKRDLSPALFEEVEA